jgi:hypothetical protein
MQILIKNMHRKAPIRWDACKVDKACLPMNIEWAPDVIPSPPIKREKEDED